MIQSNHSKPILDNSFSAFIAGLTVGIAGALLLGTEEGRKLSQKAIDSIPEDLTKLFSSNNASTSAPLPPPQITPEPPPPSPPPTKPFHKPSPTFFSS